MTRSRLIMIALCALTAGACSRKTPAERFNEKLAEKMVEHAMEEDGQSEARVDLETGQVRVTGKDGESTYAGGDDVALPDGFPRDIPIVKGARIVQAIGTPDGSSVILLTGAERKSVLDYYKSELASGGWTVENSMQTPQNDILSLKKDNRALSLMVGDSRDETVVSLSVGVMR